MPISTIHVVDDDQAVRESLEALLLVAGFDVLTFGSAEDYLARSSGGGGCLLLDVNMPGLSGLDLLGRLRGRGDAVPVLILTARRDDDLRAAALSLGARDVLAKPVPGDQLLRAVAEAVAPPAGPHTANPV